VKVVIDMNLGIDWVDCLQAAGHDAIHWSSIGAEDDDDSHILRWAAEHGYVVLTADLDFGALLATAEAPWPSVIQLRTPRTLPSFSGHLVLEVLRQSRLEIEAGALVSVDPSRFRIRPLPM
jgi:predicted nuclease of predicted toxin-antitoxin system